MEAVKSRHAPITVLIAVTVRLYRDGLAHTLSAQEQLRIVGTAGTPIEARTRARHFQPDVVIVDVSLADAVELMRSLRAETACRILALAVQDEIGTILHYAQAGAEGFVTANGSVAELVEAIERTVAGELLCSPRIAAQLLRRAASQAQRAADYALGRSLSGREQQVFSLLRQGQSNKAIAAALNIAEATVKNHVHRVLEKLHVTTRGQAAAVAAPLLAGGLERPTRRVN